MTAAEHLAKAREYAGHADDLYPTGHPEDLEAARAAAEIGRLHLDLHRELILAEHFTDRGDVAEPIPLERYRPPAFPKKVPEIGDVKDCECCATSITAVPSGTGLLWAETETSRLHDCPPPKGKTAPASPGSTAGADDPTPRKDTES